MAITYIDPCGDNYTTTELVARGWVTTASPVINAASGRRSGSSLRMTGQTMRHGRFVPKLATYYAGWAQKWSALPGSNQPLFLVFEWATEHMRITANTDGSITAFRGGVSSLGSSAAGVLASGSFQFIEVQFTIDSAAGVVLVKVDGSTVLNLTAQNTRNVGDEGRCLRERDAGGERREDEDRQDAEWSQVRADASRGGGGSRSQGASRVRLFVGRPHHSL